MVLLSKLKKTGQYFAFKVIDKHIAVQEDKVCVCGVLDVPTSHAPQHVTMGDCAQATRS